MQGHPTTLRGMATRVFDPEKLDVAAFAEAQAELRGEYAIASLERLASSTLAATDAKPVSWVVRGECRNIPGAAVQPWLHLEAHAGVALECQRCLSPVQTDLHAQRSVLFVPGEALAEELDAECDDDVLALTRSLNLRELLEDELLLTLPLVPRHDVCPHPLEAPALEDDGLEAPPHPFAALAALKAGGKPN